MNWLRTLYRRDPADFALVCFAAGALFSLVLCVAVVAHEGAVFVVMVRR